MFNVIFQGSLFHFAKDMAACMFKGNSPIKFSPLPGWDMGVTSQYTTIALQAIVSF